MRCGGPHFGDLGVHPLEGLHGDRQLRRGLGRGHVVVDEPAQLVFHLRLRRAVRLAKRTVDELVRLLELVVRKDLRRSDVRDRRRRMFASQIAVDNAPIM